MSAQGAAAPSAAAAPSRRAKRRAGPPVDTMALKDLGLRFFASLVASGAPTRPDLPAEAAPLARVASVFAGLPPLSLFPDWSPPREPAEVELKLDGAGAFATTFQVRPLPPSRRSRVARLCVCVRGGLRALGGALPHMLRPRVRACARRVQPGFQPSKAVDEGSSAWMSLAGNARSHWGIALGGTVPLTSVVVEWEAGAKKCLPRTFELQCVCGGRGRARGARIWPCPHRYSVDGDEWTTSEEVRVRACAV